MTTQEEIEEYKRSCLVVDIEANGLLEELTKIHVTSVAYYNENKGKYDVYSLEGGAFVHTHTDLLTDQIIVGHNFYLFDLLAVEKLCKKELQTDNVIDTLFLSWYIEPDRGKHGLESYGEEFGVLKPEIKDWHSLSFEDYKHRCEEDVKINTLLWHQQIDDLLRLYEGDLDRVKAIISFLMVKARVYKMQHNNPLLLNVEGVKDSIKLLSEKEEEIVSALTEVMPGSTKKMKRIRPKTMYKKDGSLSSHGEKWRDLIESLGYRLGEEPEEVTYEASNGQANPGSVSQVKDWFFSLGWEPQTFKDAVSVDGTVSKVPQVKNKEGDLCKSVIKLAEKEPAILKYEDLGIIRHRLGILKGFLKDVGPSGEITARIAGLTNTLRIRHKELVNLPSPSQKFGEHIRTHLLPPEGHVMIGSDLSSLESTTRNHFVIDIDPEFVKAQSHPFYDPHLDIAVTAGMMEKGEAVFYKFWKERTKNPEVQMAEIDDDLEARKEALQILHKVGSWEDLEHLHHRLNEIRQSAKTTNYSAMYGVGKAKLSKELNIKQSEAKALLDAYWAVNGSVKTFSSSCEIKTLDEQMWVKNPINGFWYSLRSEKDVFSTVNQSAGDFIFTLWEYFLMQEGVILRAGFHDEVVTTCPEDEVEETIQKLQRSIDKVNEVLGMKVPIQIDYKVGKNYAEVH